MFTSSKNTSISLNKARLGKLEKTLGDSETKNIIDREAQSKSIKINTSLYAINSPE